ncbi:MAG: AAA family ATPase [Bacteroidales bacterium]|nr:AAA family ATPase [Bacteroidales bacterium]
MLKQSFLLDQILGDVVENVFKERHEFVTPEHFMYYGALGLECVCQEFTDAGVSKKKLMSFLGQYLREQEKVPGKSNYTIESSMNMAMALQSAERLAKTLKKKELGVFEMILGILNLKEECPVKDYIISNMNIPVEEMAGKLLVSLTEIENNPNLRFDSDDEFSSIMDDYDAEYQQNANIEPEVDWRNYVTRINDNYTDHNPLIGRADELERTVHVLKKRGRHNVLYIGESGVGKTAMVYGLLRGIAENTIYTTESISQADFFQIDMTAVLAGSQFRGDFEKRIKAIMEGISQSKSAVVYIDDMHTMIGMGANSENSNDASQMLLQYMDRENIRFIGTTTYQEYNKHFQKNKALSRRFQTIEICEPSTDEATQILEALMPIYEKYHHVTYRNKKQIARYAVEMSQKYISNRHLPEKAIDLVDEAGAYREIHPIINGDGETMKPWVEKKLIAEMVQKVCKLSNIPDIDNNDETLILKNLEANIKAKIYGQDEAVRQVVESIQMSKAGLLDMQKPIASLLFVGQTGVGKTEIVKVLAKELNLELIRFDMSEYTEKHTVAKLIGSPAGYVGYDDGGLLTDAIRKNPNCVLLLDEIEKAHSDIYNILLQIMDYASLTDNKGQKSDFRHVILVMTSNAGAQYAHQSTVGFNGATVGSAMMTAVKKTFKPEFINRLTATVMFNDISEKMAGLILQKKIGELRERLSPKNISLEISEAAEKELLRRGFSPQYGAREIDRVINQMLNPLLMREILFGKLKKGGVAKVDFADGEMKIAK